MKITPEIENSNVSSFGRMPTPSELHAKLPLTERAFTTVMRGREALRNILDRKDKRGFPVPYVEWAQGPLREFFIDRLGYIPDPEKPWDRKWWLDLCAGQTALV